MGGFGPEGKLGYMIRALLNDGIWPEYHGRCFVGKFDGDFDMHILVGPVAHIHLMLGSACGHGHLGRYKMGSGRIVLVFWQIAIERNRYVLSSMCGGHEGR